MRKLQDIKALCFDFDGTLADTLPQIVATAQKILPDFGVTGVELERARELVGPPFPEAYSLVYGLSEEDAKAATAAYRAIYEKLGASAWPPFEGLVELCQKLEAADYTLCVVSSKRHDLVQRAMQDCGYAPYFKLIRGKKVEGKEQKSDTLAAVMQELGLTPTEIIMIGDRRFDIEAAKICKTASIGVLYGKTCEREELERAGADYICEAIEELAAVLL